jgi:hypothetical protein
VIVGGDILQRKHVVYEGLSFEETIDARVVTDDDEAMLVENFTEMTVVER